MVLTPGTSDAYGYLLKLLCDPGDEVLVPQPGYPLLDHLARLEGVVLRGYPLQYDGAWHIDMDTLKARVSERCRAIVIVNPNNPTGCYLHRSELSAMAELGIPLISDEVFSPFALVADATRISTILTAEGLLVFALGGLSKMLALPQLKLSWIAAGGPPAQVQDALARLELIADTYLSVPTPIQLAAPRLLDQKKFILTAIHERIDNALQTLCQRLEGSAATVLWVEGGWNAVVRLPNTRTEHEWALALLIEDHVLVHPGWFYDFATEPFIVVSLLTPPTTLAEGISRLRRRVQACC
jgi:aspartate/methionine/tyrosine aminotransferase